MKNKKNLKVTHDIKIMTSKYNPEVKESRKKKKSIHQKLTPDYFV